MFFRFDWFITESRPVFLYVKKEKRRILFYACFTQLFFIQPLIRTIFKLLFQPNTIKNELIKA